MFTNFYPEWGEMGQKFQNECAQILPLYSSWLAPNPGVFARKTVPAATGAGGEVLSVFPRPGVPRRCIEVSREYDIFAAEKRPYLRWAADKEGRGTFRGRKMGNEDTLSSRK